MSLTKEAIEKLQETLVLGIGPRAVGVDDVPVVVVPTGYKLETLERLEPPRFIKQRVELETLGAFIGYVVDHCRPDTAVFVRVGELGAEFTAIMDYHGADGKAGRCAHVAAYTPQASSDWKAVLAVDRKVLEQEKFALFIEDNLKLFINPTPGSLLLEVVTNLHGKLDVSFTSIRRLNNGTVQLSYEEDMAMRGAGQFELPTMLKLAVPPFDGEAPYEVDARLRCKLSSRKVEFEIQCVRLADVVRDAVRIMVERMQTELVNNGAAVDVYRGRLV